MDDLRNWPIWEKNLNLNFRCCNSIVVIDTYIYIF